MSTGITYTATGDKYVKMAALSAKSAKAQCPQLQTCLFTDQPCNNEYFDKIIDITPAHNKALPTEDKTLCISKTPFDKTLMLDADTYVVGDISEMFSILDRFDFAICHAHLRRKKYMRASKLSRNVPYAFPVFNSGVILYNSKPEVMNVLNKWNAAYKEMNYWCDQISLRSLLWSSDLRIYVLPPEYNLNRPGHIKRKKYVPKIYHYTRGKNADVEAIMKVKMSKWTK